MKTLSTLLLSSALAAGGYFSWPKGSAPVALETPVTPAPVVAMATNLGEEPLPNILAAVEEVAAPALVEVMPTTSPDAAATAALPKGEPLAMEETELITAVEQGIIQAVIQGNGRERIQVQARNNSPTPLRVTVPAGQIFENGRNLVITLRTQVVEVMPAQTTMIPVATAALLSSNRLAEGSYRLSYQYVSRVSPFISWLGENPEVGTAAAQTAILALMENLPATALGKFAPANGITSKVDTDAFRVESSDLIAALTALQKCGARVESLNLATDPQLKLELMIEPLSRESAKRFYGINEETEWDFWKHELLHGDPSTRHYALFGIARFYPEIALEMLPKWVREPKTHPVYRMSAIQALADTQKPEALSILRHLAGELGAESELGKAADQAASFLDDRLSKVVQAPVVAFRGKPTPIGL